jgi:hypothetical protein
MTKQHIVALILNLALDAGQGSAASPHRKSRCFREEKNLLTLLGIKPQFIQPTAKSLY